VSPCFLLDSNKQSFMILLLRYIYQEHNLVLRVRQFFKPQQMRDTTKVKFKERRGREIFGREGDELVSPCSIQMV
ncbi:predicted protein, partial [Arabidopsis lyrata subsp. lyrata]